MRPVSDEFEVSQEFGSFPTAGVSPNPNGSTVQRLVFQYGNYQPYGHAGQDIACPVGTPVKAIADGTVVWADWGTNLPGDDSDAGYRQRWYLYKSFPGIVTVIQHDGWLSVYGHLSSNDPAPRGTVVKEGQLIAYSGNTGGVAPHLHVAAIVDTSYRTGGGLIYGCADPAPFYGSGISLQSQSITPLEDDPLAGLTFDDVKRAAFEGGLDALKFPFPNETGGQTSVAGMASVWDKQRLEIISQTAETTVRLLLGTKLPRQGEGQSGDTDLGSVIAWSDSNFTHAGTANLGASAGLDAEAVNAAIKAGLDAALAGTTATITIGGAK